MKGVVVGLLLAGCCSSALGEDTGDPFRILMGVGATGFSVISIQSLWDDIVVDEVTMNRGNCPGVYYATNGSVALMTMINLNDHLRYGDLVKIEATCAAVIEMEIVTDKGTWTFGNN